MPIASAQHRVAVEHSVEADLYGQWADVKTPVVRTEMKL